MFLWQAKLKSRNSFLKILEFIPKKREDFRSILFLLHPESSTKFFEKYILESFQFNIHDFREDEINYAVCHLPHLKEIDWTPPKQLLMEKSTFLIAGNDSLKTFEFTNASKLQYLTFGFGKNLCPPHGTYKNKGIRKYELKEKLMRIEFGLNTLA